ncbi:prefoldin subunit 1 isoform X2 [Chiloscyllium plagiosum]|uniref:prefoldin subunit 1 isoform X2 n=1 Tax=Chiloscyllium plagiosum TaxID=36176 RepID=UPI001CB821EE|nr:prefoldin subunit 1 isoform X2 [Chiloscyllium plagiosum]
MAAPVDLELKKAFAELQSKVLDTQQKVKLADLQIEQLNRTKKHAHLTDAEISTMPEEARMYEGVGRMFILQPKVVIHNQLLEKQKIAEEKIKELEKGDLQLKTTYPIIGKLLESIMKVVVAGYLENHNKKKQSQHDF